MKVTREQAEKNRREVIGAASRLFRERGFDGIGVADIMNAAGLTHGGFYKQFESKDELISLACERALADGQRVWKQVLEKSSENPLAGIINHYLAVTQRSRIAQGCTFAALASDAARCEPALREKFEEAVVAHLNMIEAARGDADPAHGHEASIVTLATMVGALVLSRAVKSPAMGEEILTTVSRTLIDEAKAATPVKAASRTPSGASRRTSPRPSPGSEVKPKIPATRKRVKAG